MRKARFKLIKYAFIRQKKKKSFNGTKTHQDSTFSLSAEYVLRQLNKYYDKNLSIIKIILRILNNYVHYIFFKLIFFNTDSRCKNLKKSLEFLKYEHTIKVHSKINFFVLFSLAIFIFHTPLFTDTTQYRYILSSQLKFLYCLTKSFVWNWSTQIYWLWAFIQFFF